MEKNEEHIWKIIAKKRQAFAKAKAQVEKAVCSCGNLIPVSEYRAGFRKCEHCEKGAD